MRNTETSEFGPRLAAYIDRRRGDLSIREFSRLHGLDHARVSTWGSGSRPSWEHLSPTAEGLGITLGELLVIMGVGKPEDFTVVAAQPRVAEAIETDPDLTDAERAMLRDLLAMFDQVREGKNSITVSNDTPKKRSRPRNPH